jgi:predicted nucleic acid-binding protein
MTKTLVDTNILIYSVLQNDKKKHDMAKDAVKKLIDSEEMFLSSQNLSEFCRVLLEKSNPRADYFVLRDLVSDFLKFASLVSYSEVTVLEALSISARYKIHFFDALIAATMQESGIDEILTENISDFSRIPWIKTRSPF